MLGIKRKYKISFEIIKGRLINCRFDHIYKKREMGMDGSFNKMEGRSLDIPHNNLAIPLLQRKKGTSNNSVGRRHCKILEEPSLPSGSSRWAEMGSLSGDLCFFVAGGGA